MGIPAEETLYDADLTFLNWTKTPAELELRNKQPCGGCVPLALAYHAGIRAEDGWIA